MTPTMNDAPGVATHPLPTTVDEALARVLALLDERGLQLFTVIDHSGAASDAGLAMPNTKVVIFGSPKGGTPLMLAHPLLALDLPMKLLLWESDSGAAFVSCNTADYLAGRFGLAPAEKERIGVVEVIAVAISG
jgi:uncharacterized protein (DUF302 family)